MSVALRNFAFEEFEAKLEHQRLSFLAAKLERERARVIHCCSHNTNPLSTHIYTQKDTKKFPPSLNTLKSLNYMSSGVALLNSQRSQGSESIRM